MDLSSGVLKQPVKAVIDDHPTVGDILKRHNIGCTSCSLGTCLTKDIVEIHNLPAEEEKTLMKEIAGAIYPGKKVEIPPSRRKAADKKISRSPPIQKLVDEHKLIKSLLSLIPAVIKTADVSTEEGKKLVLDAADFIRSYADRYHHAKEEDILFRCFDQNLDILNVMHEDHKTGRGHVKAVLDAAERGDGKAVARHLLAYRDLLAEHIKK